MMVNVMKMLEIDFVWKKSYELLVGKLKKID